MSIELFLVSRAGIGWVISASLARPAANNLYRSTTLLVESPEPHVKAYEARYNGKPQMFAAQAFDATNIVLNAIAAAGGANATRAKVRDALAATRDFPGVSGVKPTRFPFP